jgi:hypothetical protein
VKRFLRLLPWIGGVLAIPVALIAIWQWWDRPRLELESQVTIGPYLTPPGIARLQAAWPFVLSDEMVEGAIDTIGIADDMSPRERFYFSTGLGGYLNSAIAKKFGGDGLGVAGDPKGFWRVVLRNSGSQSLSDVRVRVPYSRLTCIVTTPGRCVGSDSAILVGQMQPLDELVVVAWTHLVPNEWELEQIVITHSMGISDVKRELPIGGFWVWMARYWFLLFLFVWIGLTMIAAIASTQGNSTGHSPGVGDDS